MTTDQSQADGNPTSKPWFTRTWLWDASGDVDRLSGFAGTHDVAETAVAVPWVGVTPAVAHAVHVLRLARSAVTALGAENSWVLEIDAGLVWARRATERTRFDGLHLDVEFWNLPAYQVDPDRCVDGFVALVHLLRTSLGLPVTVDLPAGLAIENPQWFRRCAVAATEVTLLAYRDRADRICEFSASAREVLARAGIPYHLGVETQPVSAAVSSDITFGDDGRAVLDRERTLAATFLTDDPCFRGWAVHDLRSWAALPD